MAKEQVFPYVVTPIPTLGIMIEQFAATPFGLELLSLKAEEATFPIVAVGASGQVGYLMPHAGSLPGTKWTIHEPKRTLITEADAGQQIAEMLTSYAAQSQDPSSDPESVSLDEISLRAIVYSKQENAFENMVKKQMKYEPEQIAVEKIWDKKYKNSFVWSRDGRQYEVRFDDNGRCTFVSIRMRGPSITMQRIYDDKGYETRYKGGLDKTERKAEFDKLLDKLGIS